MSSGQWHTLGLKAENDRFTVSFNGKALHSTTDRTFSAPGRIALWTKSDSVTRFDQINIQGSADVTANRWHTLGVVAEKDRFTISFDSRGDLHRVGPNTLG